MTGQLAPDYAEAAQAGGGAATGHGGPPRPTRIAIGIDCTPDLAFASVMLAGMVGERILIERAVGKSPTGQLLEDHRAGTDWVIPRVKTLKADRRYRVAAILIDPMSPASVLIPEAEKAGLELTLTSTRDVGQACGLFLKWAIEGTLLHLGHANEDLRTAVAGAAKRDIGDGLWAWARKNTEIDISPLCGGTLAAWGAHKFGRGYDVLNSIA